LGLDTSVSNSMLGLDVSTPMSIITQGIDLKNIIIYVIIIIGILNNE
jgi:hypothetical protein